MEKELEILVIEDDSAIAASLSDGLSGEGYKVHWESTGGGGLAYARDKNPRLVILDVRLPDGSGIEIVVHNTGPHVPETLRERLFAKYAKGSNGKRGFGLYFCRLACEAHGGSIEYAARPDGSAFRIRLPNHA